MPTSILTPREIAGRAVSLYRWRPLTSLRACVDQLFSEIALEDADSTLLLRGRWLCLTSRPAIAEPLLRKAVDLTRSDPGHLALARCLRDSGKLEDAEALLRDALALVRVASIRGEMIGDELALVLLALGKVSEAEALLGEIHPDSDVAGRSKDDLLKMVRAHQTPETGSPPSFAFRDLYRVARGLSEMGRGAAAQAIVSEFLIDEGSHADLLAEDAKPGLSLLLGRIAQWGQSWSEAEVHVRDALCASRPTSFVHEAAVWDLVQLLTIGGRWGDAERVLLSAVDAARARGDTETAEAFARFMQTEGRTQATVDLLLRALSLG